MSAIPFISTDIYNLLQSNNKIMNIKNAILRYKDDHSFI